MLQTSGGILVKRRSSPVLPAFIRWRARRDPFQRLARATILLTTTSVIGSSPDDPLSLPDPSPAPPPEVNLANYLILNWDQLRPSDLVVLTTCRRPVSAPPKPSCSHSTDMPGIFLLHGIFPGYVDEQGNNRYRCVWLLSQCFKQYRHRLLTARFDLGVLRLAHHSVNRRMDSNPATAGKIVHHHPDLTCANAHR
jgi:hypothetical protein